MAANKDYKFPVENSKAFFEADYGMHFLSTSSYGWKRSKCGSIYRSVLRTVP